LPQSIKEKDALICAELAKILNLITFKRLTELVTYSYMSLSLPSHSITGKISKL
jgi:hypothetical protein